MQDDVPQDGRHKAVHMPIAGRRSFFNQCSASSRQVPSSHFRVVFRFVFVVFAVSSRLFLSFFHVSLVR
jgi:hypothetical protein